MNLLNELNDGKLLIKLEGRLDGSSAPELLKFYEDTLRTASLKSIELDLSQLEYSSSAGLRIMMMMYKEFKDNFIIIGANELIKEIFETTGFGQFLNIR